jgi:hypothetical protein
VVFAERPGPVEGAEPASGSAESTKEDVMAEYARVTEFRADEAAIDAMVERIAAENGAPEGVNATRITVLADRSAGRLLIPLRFPSEEDLRSGAAVLEEMSPPDSAGGIRRVAVESYEVLLERTG